jgi:hypothetical protein
MDKIALSELIELFGKAYPRNDSICIEVYRNGRLAIVSWDTGKGRQIESFWTVEALVEHLNQCQPQPVGE